MSDNYAFRKSTIIYRRLRYIPLSTRDFSRLCQISSFSIYNLQKIADVFIFENNRKDRLIAISSVDCTDKIKTVHVKLIFTVVSNNRLLEKIFLLLRTILNRMRVWKKVVFCWSDKEFHSHELVVEQIVYIIGLG